MWSSSVAVYRQLLRSAGQFPVKPVAKKLKFNIREVVRAHRNEENHEKIVKLHGDAAAALRVLAFLKQLPEVSSANTGTTATPFRA
jgi:hypothetical protein